MSLKGGILHFVHSSILYQQTTRTAYQTAIRDLARCFVFPIRQRGGTCLVKILVASKSVPVFEALRTMPDIEIQPALTTEQIAKNIPSAQLVILDSADVVEYPYELGMIQALLAEAREKRGLPWTRSDDFLADPEQWIARASRARGGLKLPDKLTVGFTSYSGGVGKTTLALDMALHFARRAERPVLLLEFVYGASALAALTGKQMVFLYDLVSKVDVQSTVFKGVTLIPMDYDNCSLLPPEEFGKYFRKQIARHVLTIVDTTWPHGLVRSIQDDVDQWLVTATPRLDAIENAKKLQQQLGPKASIILNQKRGAADSLALTGIERGLDLPHVDRVDEWAGKLGKPLLNYVYGPAWREYEQSQNIFASLARGFGRRRAVGER